MSDNQDQPSFEENPSIMDEEEQPSLEEDQSFIEPPTNQDIPIIEDDSPSQFDEQSTEQSTIEEQNEPAQIQVPPRVARNVEDPTKAAQVLGIDPEDVMMRNESNAGLLRSMEGTIGEIMNRLLENDQLISQIANTVMMLKDSLNKCNEDITTLRQNLKTNVPDSIKQDYESQINSLQQEKDETRRLIQVLSSKMKEVNAKVKAQSDQLNMIKTAGKNNNSPSVDYKKKLKKLKSMKRDELEKIAKKWGLYPASYPRKSDLVNAIQLVAYASMLKLNKRPKEELFVLANNMGIKAKSKKDLITKLEKKMSSIKI